MHLDLKIIPDVTSLYRTQLQSMIFLYQSKIVQRRMKGCMPHAPVFMAQELQKRRHPAKRLATIPD
jgi:hypothetical protein